MPTQNTRKSMLQVGEGGQGERVRGCVHVLLATMLPCTLHSPAKAVAALALGVRDEAWSRVRGVEMEESKAGEGQESWQLVRRFE